MVEHEGEVALVVVEMRFEGSDGEVFGEVEDGIGHSEWERKYASDGGTLFLKVIWLMFGCYSDGYMTIDYDIRATKCISQILDKQ